MDSTKIKFNDFFCYDDHLFLVFTFSECSCWANFSAILKVVQNN